MNLYPESHSMATAQASACDPQPTDNAEIRNFSLQGAWRHPSLYFSIIRHGRFLAPLYQFALIGTDQCTLNRRADFSEIPGFRRISADAQSRLPSCTMCPALCNLVLQESVSRAHSCSVKRIFTIGADDDAGIYRPGKVIMAETENILSGKSCMRMVLRRFPARSAQHGGATSRYRRP